MTKDSLIQQAFEVAAERYAVVGVDVRKALEDMKKISLSLHCWQADDVSGFENQDGRRGIMNVKISSSIYPTLQCKFQAVAKKQE